MPERCFLTLTQQVAAHLHDPIRRGRWSAGMPGRHELAKELGISDQTAEAALSQLEAEGLLEAQGAGRRRRVVPPKGAGGLAGTLLRVAILVGEPADQRHDYIVKINLLSRIVRVRQRKFYLCPFCVQVHEWMSSGHELQACARMLAAHRPLKGCVICSHTNSSNVTHILDSHIGVMQRVVLCNRHMPYEHQMRYVHDLDSLVARIQSKFRRRD